MKPSRVELLFYKFQVGDEIEGVSTKFRVIKITDTAYLLRSYNGNQQFFDKYDIELCCVLVSRPKLAHK